MTPTELEAAPVPDSARPVMDGESAALRSAVVQAAINDSVRRKVNAGIWPSTRRWM